jgi:hypothetical protein
MAVIIGQNARRRSPVPEKVIRELAGKTEPPTITESHALTILCHG